DPPATLEQRREERPCPQFRDLCLDVSDRGRDRLGTVAVSVGRAALGALVAVGADLRRGFGLDQRLQAGPHQLGEHGLRIGGQQCIELGVYARMGLGHRVVCPYCELLGGNSLTTTRWPALFSGPPRPRQPEPRLRNPTTQWDLPREPPAIAYGACPHRRCGPWPGFRLGWLTCRQRGGHDRIVARIRTPADGLTGLAPCNIDKLRVV